MSPSAVLEAANLPEPALPFVRELILEIARRVPANLGTPPRFVADDLQDPATCADSARSLVQWFDVAPESLGRRMEELEALFTSLLEVVQSIDTRVRRAVRQAREREEEEITFVHSLSEVLADLRADLSARPALGDAARMLGEVLRRIEARQSPECGGDAGPTNVFDRLHDDLDQLRGDLRRVEQQARELRRQSLRDPLTGLWNRRAYDARVAEELTRAVRYDFPLAIALWDIDSFKAVNARYDHTVGDLVLQSISGRVLAMLRRSDFLARVDGATFAVIFTSTAGAQARLAADKICGLVAGKPVDSPAGKIRLTASVGVAALARGDDADTLHRRAREQLRTAKTAGRNRASGPGEPSVHLEAHLVG